MSENATVELRAGRVAPDDSSMYREVIKLRQRGVKQKL